MRNRSADAVVVGDVERHDVGIAAFGLDLGAQALQPLDPAAGERDAGAGLGENARELRAEAARGAGDEGDSAREIDLIAHLFVQRLRSVESTDSLDARQSGERTRERDSDDP